MKNKHTTSAAGLKTLKGHEAVVNGLYDDPSGFATYGTGHLVQKFPSVLLDTARIEKLCQSRVKTKWAGTANQTDYLEREVVGCEDYTKLTTRAAERAPEIVAKSKYNKSLASLTDKQKAIVRGAACSAVAEEARLLNVPVDDVLHLDVAPFEKEVNQRVTGVSLTQGEFDALVSFVFNVGTTNFATSTLLKKINENKFRAGDIGSREKAIAVIEAEFLKWNKSAGKKLPGLEKRRKAEAAAFLKTARTELAALKAKTMGPPAPKSARTPQPPVPEPVVVYPPR